MFVLTLTALLASSADAKKPTCPSVDVRAPSTAWDADRVWIHEPGWFTPLQDPETVQLSQAGYDAHEPMLALRVQGETRAWPVGAMSYHHVANDVVGGEPVVVTY